MSTTHCFNRYMVECESATLYHDSKVDFVLIDTWWNVNICAINSFHFCIFVLIDTWWNVNAVLEAFLKRKSSFNRYMVECEYSSAIVILSFPILF